jgi:hypothetical protein
MKNLIAALAIGSLAVPALAAPGSLPGISDEETTIPAGGITQYHVGKGDVMFVRDRVSRWYRLQLNEGCLRTPPGSDAVSFGQDGASGRIDKFTQVRFLRDGRACGITSIRRSVPPPQADSKSPVTLD